MVIRVVVLLSYVIFMLSGCSDGSSKYPDSTGMSPPYILKEGCKFTIVNELSKTSITSPVLTGMDGATASASISLGGDSITVSSCEVTENAHGLPIYED